VRNDSLAPSYSNGQPVPRAALLAFIEDLFVPFGTFPPFVIEKRRS